MADEFFNNESVQEAPVTEEVQKIKVGEDEYTQEELSKLVGLGKIGQEAETKFKTRIDRVWPNYQQVINEKRELEQRLQQIEAEKNQPAAPQAGPTPEQIKAEAIRQAEALGIGPEAVRRQVMEVVQGQRLIDDIGRVIDTMSADGLPSTTIEDVIAHMQQTGIRNPEKAYKDMFEKEYVSKQAEKIAEIKRPGIPTVRESQAGAKQPAPVRVTTDNLESLVAEALKGSFE